MEETMSEYPRLDRPWVTAFGALVCILILIGFGVAAYSFVHYGGELVATMIHAISPRR